MPRPSRQTAARPRPDLSRQAFIARLHCPAPRSEDPTRMLTQPPRWEPPPNGRPAGPGSPLRSQNGFSLSTALLLSLHQERRLLARQSPAAANQISASLLNAAGALTDLQKQTHTLLQELTVPGLSPGGPPPEARLLPTRNYQEFRSRLDPLLEQHRTARETWLRELLPRRRRQAAAQGRPDPEESALRQEWQARLELARAPTLAEYISQEKEPELRGLRQELYQQAEQRLRRLAAAAPSRPRRR